MSSSDDESYVWSSLVNSSEMTEMLNNESDEIYFYEYFYDDHFEMYDRMRDDFISFFMMVSTLQRAIKGLICVLGAVMNGGFLATILLDIRLRGCFRNQVICSLLIVYFLDSASEIPSIVDTNYRSHLIKCYESSKIAASDFLEDNVENLLFILLLLVYMAQILSLDLRPKLGPRKTQIGAAALLIGPWCIGLLLVLANIPAVNVQKKFYTIFMHHCFTIEFYKATNIIDIVLLSIAVLLLFLAVALKYSRFAGCCSDRGHSEPQYQGTNIDPAKMYIVAVVLLVVFQLPYHIVPLLGEKFHVIHDTSKTAALWISFETVNDCRHVFMPLVWILLPEIRRRVQSLLPRCRRRFSKATDLVPVEKAENCNI